MCKTRREMEYEEKAISPNDEVPQEDDNELPPPDELMRDILQNYIDGNNSINDAIQQIASFIPSEFYVYLVFDSITNVLSKSPKEMQQTGQLFAVLVKSHILSLGDYCNGLEAVVECNKNNLPALNSLGLVTAPLVKENVVTARNMYQLYRNCEVKANAPILFASIFKSVLGKDVGFDDRHHVSPVDINRFPQSEIYYKLLELLGSDMTLKGMVKQIAKYINESGKNVGFIKTLARACLMISIGNLSQPLHSSSQEYNLLSHYTRGNTDYQQQCVATLEDIAENLKCLPEVILAVCKNLYSEGVVPSSIFLEWYDKLKKEKNDGFTRELEWFFSELKKLGDNPEISY